MTRLKSFLEHVFGRKVEVSPFSSPKLPPIFSRYEIAKVELDAANAFLALIDRQKFPTRVAQAIGQAKWASGLLGLPAVYVSPKMDRLMRFRMREKHAEFIDLSAEVYLPVLGCVVRRNAPAPKPVNATPGFPAQRFVLARLNHLLTEPVTVESLRGQFGYSAVTVIGALKELEAQDIVRRETMSGSRRQAVVFNLSGRTLWNRMEPFFKSPILERVAVDSLPSGFSYIPSGETALATISMLNPPVQPCFAVCVTAAARKALKAQRVVLDDGKYVIEFWRYPPLLPGAETLDPLTTIVATRDIATDERVAGEHEELLEAFRW